MLLQSPRALCKTPGGPGSIWNYLEALVRATRVSGRFARGCKDAYTSLWQRTDIDGNWVDTVANVDSSDSICISVR